MAFTANETASMRSLTDLKLVMPPIQQLPTNNNRENHNYEVDTNNDLHVQLEKWDPFPTAPYAPGQHPSHADEQDARDDEQRQRQQSRHRSAFDYDYIAQRQASPTMVQETMREVHIQRNTPRASNNNNNNKNHKHEQSPGEHPRRVACHTPPPRIPHHKRRPPPEVSTITTLSSSSSSYSTTSSPSHNSSGIGNEKMNERLIKITPNGSVSDSENKKKKTSDHHHHHHHRTSPSRSRSRNRPRSRVEDRSQVLTPLGVQSTNNNNRNNRNNTNRNVIPAAVVPSPDSRQQRSTSKKQQQQQQQQQQQRHRSFSPMLTRRRVDLHLKTQCENEKTTTTTTTTSTPVSYDNSPDTPSKNRMTKNNNGVKGPIPPPPPPHPPSSSKSDQRIGDKVVSSPSVKLKTNTSNNVGGHSDAEDATNPKIFMVGMTKVYSRTLIPPTVYHNAVTDLWIVTINTSSNSKNTLSSTSSSSSSSSSSNNNNSKSNNTDTTNNRSNNSNNNGNNNGNNGMNNQNFTKAFSFHTEKEARASAYANAPPVMIPFATQTSCMLCDAKFTLFKRPRHCRNCGICICNSYDCCTSWSKKMIPETFNIKKEGAVKVCTSCHVLTRRFRHALLEGRYGSALEIYLSGNINLRVPFAFKEKKKGGNSEHMFPIHCAIEGQSEKLVRWLVDVQHCPIRVMSTGNANRTGRSSGYIGGGGVIGSAVGAVGAGAEMIKSLGSTMSRDFNHHHESKHQNYMPTIKTSKGRSVMDIAMKTQHVGILRYLINEKDASVYEVQDLELALGSLEALVRTFPEVDGTYDPEIYAGTKEEEKGGFAKIGGGAGVGGGNHAEERKRGSGGNGDYRGVGKKLPASAVRLPSKSVKAKQRGRTAAGGVVAPSPTKARIYSHSLVSPSRKEKMLLPRDIHGGGRRRNREVVGLYGTVGGHDGNNDDDDISEDERHNNYDGSGNNQEEEEEHDTILLEDDNSVSTTVPDICILCREKDVDCVATPCGHQMCCLSCSNQCLRCPICNLECHFIETYQP